MKYSKFTRYILIISLFILLSIIPVAGVGCAGNGTSGAIADVLAATMVPNVNLDAYLYFDQRSPTVVPGNFISSPADIKVDNLAIWGIINENDYVAGGALTFTSAADASNIYNQIPKQSDIWTKLSDRTIYVVRGSSGPAESLKTAISNNNFKRYDDKKALSEVSLMPVGDTTKPAAIAVIKPNKAMVDWLKKYSNANVASTIDGIYTWGKPQTIVIGLYSSQPIDITNTAQKISNKTIWDADLGLVASVDSALPGLIFNPVAGQFLDNGGYTKITSGGLTEYKITIDGGSGRTIPILVNLSGNHVFVTSSGKESYAQTLMAGIKR